MNSSNFIGRTASLWKQILFGAALTATVAAPSDAFGVFTVAHNLPTESDWTFNHKMTQSPEDGNTWYIENINITECNSNSTEANTTAWFTFFNDLTGDGSENHKWDNNTPISKRFGADAKDEPIISPNKSYSATLGTEDCFIINTNGTYSIKLTTYNNGKNARIMFYDSPTVTDKGPITTTDPNPDPNPQPNPDSNFDSNGAFHPLETDENYSLYFPAAKDYIFFVNENNWADPTIWNWNDTNQTPLGVAWGARPSMKKYKEPNIYIWVNTSQIHDGSIIISDRANESGNRVEKDYKSYATYYSGGDVKGGGIYTPPQPSESAGKVSGWENDGTTVTITCEKATLYITPYSEKVVKVFTLPNGETKQERKSITVVAEPNVSYTVNEHDHTINIEIPNGTTVGVDKETGLITFMENGQEVRLAEKRYLDNTTHTVNLKVPETEPADIAFYGGGPSSIKGSIMNETIVMDNHQDWGWDCYLRGPHNIGIPFVVSTSNYGVLFDDHYRGAEINTSANSGVSYKSNSITPISYYYVGGENMDEVIANYTHLTGRQPLPPYWSLGYITSKYGYHSFSEGDDVIKRIRNINYPLDGIVYDLYWQGNDETALGTLNWGPQFPNPVEKLANWKKMGIHTTLITEPYFTSFCSNWNKISNTAGWLADSHVDANNNMDWLNPNGENMWNWHVGLIDATNPEAMDWMYQFYKARTEEGVDGWWLDLGEPEGYDPDSQHKGGTPEQVHNEFGQTWVGYIHDRITADFPNMRQFFMPRSGTSGMQRYSAFPWTGDIKRSWNGFKAQVPSLINMSMAGMSMTGSDIGGFAAPNGELDALLYLRWVQFGALSPMLRTHSAVQPEPFNDVYNRVRENVRKAINLRYRLLPYVYTLAYENTAFGYPMARPACAFDVNKNVLAESNDSYLWGKDLFVAPILSSDNKRNITFPEGEWADMNDVLEGKEVKTYGGHQTVPYEAPEDRIPFFMKKGSFIPMFTQTDNFVNTSELDYSDLTVYHYLDYGNEHESKLYEDDCTSPSAIADGKYAVTTFKSENVADDLFNIYISTNADADTSVLPETRTIHIYCFGYTGGDIDGLNIELPESVDARRSRVATLAEEGDDKWNADEVFGQWKKNSLEEAQNAEGHAIYHDPQKQMLYVKANNIPTTGNIKVVMGDIPTAIDRVLESGVTLAYSGGHLNYSVDKAASEAVIDIYTADGRLIASVEVDELDGFVHSVEAPAADGFCIARLTARDSYGNRRTANCKYFVK
ncbi:MAG: DUF4968 domain-containing protein [Muribaculaceae bacterium]|nr:DUF4968 domain-containing protein [Muribaculaceae bacterium]